MSSLVSVPLQSLGSQALSSSLEKFSHPPNPGESGVLRGGGRAACSEAVGLGWLQATSFFLAVCQSVVYGTILKPRSALSSEKSREAVCQDIQYLIEYLFMDSFIESP